MASQTYEIDFINRDPNGLNDHLKVAFEDVLAEPDGAHSINCVWNCTYKCFEGWKSCCYNFHTILFGIFLAMYWGYEFAIITFYHVWCYTPYMRAYMINCACLQKFFGTAVQCCCQPVFESFSYLFSNIRVTKSSG